MSAERLVRAAEDGTHKAEESRITQEVVKEIPIFNMSWRPKIQTKKNI